MTQVAMFSLVGMVGVCLIVTTSTIITLMRRARIIQDIYVPVFAPVQALQRPNTRDVAEEPLKQDASPMRRADLPPGRVVSNAISIFIEPDDTEPIEPVSEFRRYVDKDGTTRRHVMRIIERLEDVKKAS